MNIIKYKKGDMMYVPSSMSISNGSSDMVGGLATIDEIEISKSLPFENTNSIMVSFEEFENRGWNYRLLLEKQDALKKQFGDNKAYPDPDIDRPWIEDGDFVDGHIYHGPSIW